MSETKQKKVPYITSGGYCDIVEVWEGDRGTSVRVLFPELLPKEGPVTIYCQTPLSKLDWFLKNDHIDQEAYDFRKSKIPEDLVLIGSLKVK
jgi:hypothetical protein